MDEKIPSRLIIIVSGVPQCSALSPRSSTIYLEVVSSEVGNIHDCKDV